MRVDSKDLPTCDLDVDIHSSDILDDRQTPSSEDMHIDTEDTLHDSDTVTELHQTLCERSAFLEELDMQEQEPEPDDDTVSPCFDVSPVVENTRRNSAIPLYEGSLLVRTKQCSSDAV